MDTLCPTPPSSNAFRRLLCVSFRLFLSFSLSTLASASWYKNMQMSRDEISTPVVPSFLLSLPLPLTSQLSLLVLASWPLFRRQEELHDPLDRPNLLHGLTFLFIREVRGHSSPWLCRTRFTNVQTSSYVITLHDSDTLYGNVERWTTVHEEHVRFMNTSCRFVYEGFGA